MTDPVRSWQDAMSAAVSRFGRGRFAGSERKWNYARGEKQLERVLDLLERVHGVRPEGRSALDFGCGGGRLAVPLATRCAHVTGVDVDLGALERTAQRAAELGIENLTVLPGGDLDSLAGKYDLLVSTSVFQHIPSRTGEQLLGQLVRGLAPGGAAVIHLVLKPSVGVAARRGFGGVYVAMNSYSLNRVGRILTDAGIRDWHVTVTWRDVENPDPREDRYDNVLVTFVKP